MKMIRLSPQAMSCLYGKDIIAYGTGVIGKRIIPYLVQDSTLRLRGVTNSRITADDAGTFLDTGLPIRSVQTWAKLFPNATVLITSMVEINEITATCNSAGLSDVQVLTGDMMNALIKMEDQIAESQAGASLRNACLANEIQDIHKASFAEFKGCNRGKTAVVVGTGPTLNYYTPIAGASHIGVNASFLKEGLELEFYFLTHYLPEWTTKLKEYSFTKFFGINTSSNSADQFPEYVIEENNGRTFFSTSTLPGIGAHRNLEYYPLMGGHNTIAFPAIHFALYTRPKNLLLVGCDCSLSGHFDGTVQGTHEGELQIPQWIDGYREIKKFADIHYPDTEFISVNPVGLKGIFRDVYTEGYLYAHPELKASSCEMLSSIGG